MSLYVILLNCFLSAVMLFNNWRVNRNSIFLSLLIIFLSSYCISYYFLIENQNRFWIAVFFGHPAPLWLLGGPLLFLYTRGTLEDKFKLRRYDLLHLIPSLISLVGIFPYIISPFESKLLIADSIIKDLQSAKRININWLIPSDVNLLIRPSLMIIYSILSIRKVWMAQRRFPKSSIPYSQWEFSRKWLLLLSVIMILVSMQSFAVSFYYCLDLYENRMQVSSNIFMHLLEYTLTLLSMTIIFFPQVLYGMPRSGKKTVPATQTEESSVTDNEQAEAPPVDTAFNLVKENRIEQDPFNDLAERVLAVMNEKKPYLDRDFSLDDLAALLDIPKHHLYYCFQNVLHTKFTRMRTGYRIEHAKQLLAEADLRKVTLDSVGRESGFASTSAFYHTFKAEVGCSPGEFAQANNHSSGSDFL